MANTEFPQPELPGVMRVTPAGVTLEVVAGPTLERGGMPLQDEVGANGKRAQLLKIKAEVFSMWDKGCILINYVRNLT